MSSIELPAAGFDQVYRFSGYHRCESWCRVRVWKLGGGAVGVMLSECADNPGTSVTNAFEMIATSLVETGVVPVSDRVVWMEHYPERRGGVPETFCRVRMDRLGCRHVSPVWSHLNAADVLRMLGPELERAPRVSG